MCAYALLLVLEGPLWRCGLAGAHRRDGALAAAGWEGPPWRKHSWGLPLTLQYTPGLENIFSPEKKHMPISSPALI